MKKYRWSAYCSVHGTRLFVSGTIKEVNTLQNIFALTHQGVFGEPCNTTETRVEEENNANFT